MEVPEKEITDDDFDPIEIAVHYAMIMHLCLRQGNNMKEFIALREFLLLKQVIYPQRSVFDNVTPIDRFNSSSEDLVVRYDIAKASWEKYGDEGPPVGSRVKTLVSGFGSNSPVICDFVGNDSKDDRFFIVTRQFRNHNRKYTETYLLDKNLWWIYVKVN